MKVMLRIRQHVINLFIIRVPGVSVNIIQYDCFVSVNDQFGNFYSKLFRRFGKKGNYEIIILVYYIHSKVYHTFRGSYYTLVVTRRPFFTVLLARYTVRTKMYSKLHKTNSITFSFIEVQFSLTFIYQIARTIIIVTIL